ncbi:carbonic anhydrase, partial [Streptomyces albiflaviniger]|nr:carbonic anhydrase [Streptomyces albiflaviniger]
AMTVLAEDQDVTGTPAIADWLRHADASRARATTVEPSTSTVDELVRQNVLAQLANLATHPSVARALATNAVTRHGWVFDIATGSVEELDAIGRSAALAA